MSSENIFLSLNFHDRPEIQGSDSGISVQSREGIVNQPFLKQNNLFIIGQPQIHLYLL